MTASLSRGTLAGDTTLELPEFDNPPVDPIGLLQTWIEGALERRVREPLALALATTDGHGAPSSRIVLLKALDARGIVFTSHHSSRKGRDLSAVPRAAATLYWRETAQQVNVAGGVELLTDEESDALFAERPRAAQATTAASEQSRVLSDECELHRRADQLLHRDGAIARPRHWGGYRLVLEHIEFWHGSRDRFHRRLQYGLTGGCWDAVRLQP